MGIDQITRTESEREREIVRRVEFLLRFLTANWSKPIPYRRSDRPFTHTYTETKQRKPVLSGIHSKHRCALTRTPSVI